MKVNILLIKFLLFSLVASAQPSFPTDWVGMWQGVLSWQKTGEKEPQLISMVLNIQPLDSIDQYTWQLIYGEAEKDNRPYTLKAIDVAKGHWVIDEHNGIVLDQYLIGNRFTGAFTVSRSQIINSYTLENDKLVVEFYNIAAEAVNTTGYGTEESPEVKNFSIRSYQKAILEKVK